jgi:hypothetical protein
MSWIHAVICPCWREAWILFMKQWAVCRDRGRPWMCQCLPPLESWCQIIHTERHQWCLARARGYQAKAARGKDVVPSCRNQVQSCKNPLSVVSHWQNQFLQLQTVTMHVMCCPRAKLISAREPRVLVWGSHWVPSAQTPSRKAAVEQKQYHLRFGNGEWVLTFRK